jgi:crossover junction endodeoxyribonuclease RuvC
MRILGIDPGSVATGYGVIEQCAGRLQHLAHGTLRPPRGEALAARLAAIHGGLSEVIEAHRPDLAVVEQVFVATSPRSALVLGQARGAALAAAAAAGLVVHEVGTREVKLALVGTGVAAKRQVQEMVRQLLALEARPPQDAADALAAAICRAHQGTLAGLVRPSAARRGAARRRGRGGGFVVRRGR